MTKPSEHSAITFNPTLELLAKPYGKRLLKDWAFWSSLSSVVVFAGLTRWLPINNRGDIVRATVTLCVPLLVALLAIAVAAFTIFATLSTDDFRDALKEEYDYLISFFFTTMSATMATTLYAILLFLLSYAPNIVLTNGFFWACMLGLASMLFCFLQVLDTGRTVSLQVLALRKLAPNRRSSSKGDV